MHRFVLLLSVACVLLQLTAARPELSLGYRYNQGHSSGGGQLLSAPIALTSNSYSPTVSDSSYFSAQPAIGHVSSVGGGFAPSTQSVLLNHGGGGSLGFGGIGIADFSHNAQSTQINYAEQQAFLHHLQSHQAPIVTKHFYVHSAPVDHDEQQIVRYVNVGRPQKNYRVVFIDAPTSSASKAKIIANVAPVEDKTAIYVLSKKSNALDVSAEVVTPAPSNHKPEVFFIKYKTPEEAVHAQRTIQAQYDALGGSSDVSNEGVVPVSSVIGSLDGHGTTAGAGSSISSSSSSSLGDAIGSFIGNDAEATLNLDTGAAVPIVHSGDNTQESYLPSQRVRI